MKGNSRQYSWEKAVIGDLGGLGLFLGVLGFFTIFFARGYEDRRSWWTEMIWFLFKDSLGNFSPHSWHWRLLAIIWAFWYSMWDLAFFFRLSKFKPSNIFLLSSMFRGVLTFREINFKIRFAEWPQFSSVWNCNFKKC